MRFAVDGLGKRWAALGEVAMDTNYTGVILSPDSLKRRTFVRAAIRIDQDARAPRRRWARCVIPGELAARARIRAELQMPSDVGERNG